MFTKSVGKGLKIDKRFLKNTFSEKAQKELAGRYSN